LIWTRWMKSEPLPRNTCRSFSVLFRVNVSPHHISLEYLIYHLSLGMSSHREGRTKLHEIKVSEKLEKEKGMRGRKTFPKSKKQTTFRYWRYYHLTLSIGIYFSSLSFTLLFRVWHFHIFCAHSCLNFPFINLGVLEEGSQCEARDEMRMGITGVGMGKAWDSEEHQEDKMGRRDRRMG
jgi:hypothetical protein